MRKADRATPGRKPKPDGQKVEHYASAGFTGEEWPKVLEVLRKTGKTKSTIIRAAFGFGPAKK